MFHGFCCLDERCWWRDPDLWSQPHEESSQTIYLSQRQRHKGRKIDTVNLRKHYKDIILIDWLHWLTMEVWTQCLSTASVCSPLMCDVASFYSLRSFELCVCLSTQVCVFITFFRAMLQAVFVHCVVDGIGIEGVHAILRKMSKVHLPSKHQVSEWWTWKLLYCLCCVCQNWVFI